MWKRATLLCFCLVLTTRVCNGQDLKEVKDALTSLQTRVTTMLTSINKTVSSCCQCSGASTCGADSVARNQWKLAFRGTAGVRKSVFYAYKDGTGIPAEVESGCKQVGRELPCSNHYRNNAILDNWSGVSEVALAVYKNNVKVKQVIFDGTNSNYMNWFDKARVKDSSWTDLKTQAANYFSIQGEQARGLLRTFFINSVYGSCPNDLGWFVAVDNENGGCEWEKNSAFPLIKYSKLDVRVNWNDAANVGSADCFAIFVRHFNLP